MADHRAAQNQRSMRIAFPDRLCFGEKVEGQNLVLAMKAIYRSKRSCNRAWQSERIRVDKALSQLRILQVATRDLDGLVIVLRCWPPGQFQLRLCFLVQQRQSPNLLLNADFSYLSWRTG